MTFLRNCWYMAGWSDEVEQDGKLARRIAGQSLLMFRDEHRTVHAIQNRCPHRFAPLDLGELKNGRITCAYHGLAFDGSGACVHNPHGDHNIPSAAHVRSYPIEDRYNILWVWTGDAKKADPSAIPDFSCLNEATHYYGQGYLYAQVDYRLETDNIMDLSHIQYLHPGTLGSNATSSGETEVSQSGSTIWSKRQNKEPLSEFFAKKLGVPAGTMVERRMDVRWDPPATMLLYAYFRPVDGPENAERGRMIVNIFSPETEATTHYWFAVSYDKQALGVDGREIAQRATDELRIPFESEDLPMLEAVQNCMDGEDFWGLRPVILRGDAGAVRARRVLDKLIRDEAHQASVAA